MRVVVGTGQTPITSGSAYSSGQAIGSTITIARVADFGFGTVLNLALIDLSDQKAPIDVLIFNQPLAVPQTDKTTIAIGTVDAPNLIGHISLTTGSWSDLGSTAVATIYNMWMAVAGGVDNNLYCQLVSRGTPTYTRTDALRLKLTSQVAGDF